MSTKNDNWRRSPETSGSDLTYNPKYYQRVSFEYLTREQEINTGFVLIAKRDAEFIKKRLVLKLTYDPDNGEDLIWSQVVEEEK